MAKSVAKSLVKSVAKSVAKPVAKSANETITYAALARLSACPQARALDATRPRSRAQLVRGPITAHEDPGQHNGKSGLPLICH